MVLSAAVARTRGKARVYTTAATAVVAAGFLLYPQWRRWNTAPAVAAMKYGSRILLCRWQFLISHITLSLSLFLTPLFLSHSRRLPRHNVRAHTISTADSLCVCHVFFTYTPPPPSTFDSNKRYSWFITVLSLISPQPPPPILQPLPVNTFEGTSECSGSGHEMNEYLSKNQTGKG